MSSSRFARTMGLFTLFGCIATGVSQAATLQLAVDNDYALFVGTVAGGPSRLIYQNGVVWNNQIATSASFNFDLLRGETTFFLVAMGGGGAQENVSGKINGYNIVKPGMRVSPSIADSIFAGIPVGGDGTRATVANGTFSVTLEQIAALVSGFSSPANWTVPVSATSAETVIASNPHSGGIGYKFDTNQAHIYRFSTYSVGMAPVPETSSSLALGGLLSVALLSRKRRR